VEPLGPFMPPMLSLVSILLPLSVEKNHRRSAGEQFHFRKLGTSVLSAKAPHQV
jgi:hypothetical protein